VALLKTKYKNEEVSHDLVLKEYLHYPYKNKHMFPKVIEKNGKVSHTLVPYCLWKVELFVELFFLHLEYPELKSQELEY